MFIRSPKELALMVIHYRKLRGMSQTEVGNLVGLKQKTISAFENKPEGTKVSTLFQILSAVHLDMEIISKDSVGKKISEWTEEW